MNKEKAILGLIGLLAGLIFGYIGTNYINKTYGPSTGASTAGGPGAPAPGGGEVPSGHPPLDSSQANLGQGQADVTATIQKARNEPGNFEAQMQAANLYSQIGRSEQALEFLERAQQIRQDDFSVLSKLGDARFDMNQYEEAAKWYEKALKVKPKDAVVRMDLGLTYYLRQPKEIDRAVAEYKAALKDSPGNEKVLQNLVQALIDKGDKAGANQYLQELEKANPRNPVIGQFRTLMSK